jgi:hypothetical protein
LLELVEDPRVVDDPTVQEPVELLAVDAMRGPGRRLQRRHPDHELLQQQSDEGPCMEAYRSGSGLWTYRWGIEVHGELDQQA